MVPFRTADLSKLKPHDSCSCRFPMIAERDLNRRRVYLFWLLSATLLGVTSSLAQDQTNGLVSQWVADDYVSGGAWTDRIKGTIAVVDGTPSPVAVPNQFGFHKGVMRNTGATGHGGFLIPGSNPPTGLTNYTVAVVFQAPAAGPTRRQLL